jgi:hypothetical protein
MPEHDPAKKIIRDLPESFWDIAAWKGEDLLSMDASVDVADRLRIVQGILNATEDQS